MIPQVLKALRSSVVHRVWILSDLQQADPVRSRVCLTTAVRDFQQLGLACEQIWYLGDAVEGSGLQQVQAMADMHIELLEPLSIPLRYVLGNHDFDMLRNNSDLHPADAFPFYQKIRSVAGWKTVPSPESFYFTDSLGEYSIVFLSDHCSRQGDWHTTNGQVLGNVETYPYLESDYKRLARAIETSNKPTILAGHYAFAGGNRPSRLLNQLLPLPVNVRIHFHGHAHIGDSKWAGKDCYRKISSIENQPLPQINVSSLENVRGDHIRSVIFEIYEDESMGIYFRDHDRGAWADMYMIGGSAEKGGVDFASSGE